MLLEIVAALGVRGEGAALFEQPPLGDVGGDGVLDEKYGYALMRGSPGLECGVPSGRSVVRFFVRTSCSVSLLISRSFLCVLFPPRQDFFLL